MFNMRYADSMEMPLFRRPIRKIIQNYFLKGILVLWKIIPAVREA